MVHFKSWCSILSPSSKFRVLFIQTCTFLKKRRFSEDVVFQKTTSRQHGRYQISALAESTAHARQVHHGPIASESCQLAIYRSWGFVVTNSSLFADDANCAIDVERRVRHSEVPAPVCGQLKAFQRDLSAVDLSRVRCGVRPSLDLESHSRS